MLFLVAVVSNGMIPFVFSDRLQSDFQCSSWSIMILSDSACCHRRVPFFGEYLCPFQIVVIVHTAAGIGGTPNIFIFCEAPPAVAFLCFIVFVSAAECIVR